MRERDGNSKQGLSATELATKVGIKPRTLRQYTSTRLLPSPAFRGPATRYSRSHLISLAAICWLRRERKMPLIVIKQYLKSVGPNEVLRLAIAFLPELATPQEAAPSLAHRGPEEAGVVSHVKSQAGTEGIVETMWRRLVVAPGVELHIATASAKDADSLATAVAHLLGTKARHEDAR